MSKRPIAAQRTGAVRASRCWSRLLSSGFRDTKKKISFFFLAVGSLVLSGGFLHAEEGASLATRSFQFTYQVLVSQIPPKTEELQLWIPLAKSNGYQRVHERVVRSEYPYNVLKELEYDNDVLYLKLERTIPETLALEVDYAVSVNGLNGVANRFDPPVKEAFLASNRLMVVNDRVRKIAAKVTNGKSSDRDKARALYEYVFQHMRYDKSGSGWGRGDTLRACEVGTGNCTDFHSLFISLARASGIPSRFHMGTSIPQEPGQKISGYHCWADFYVQGEGWIPVDISEAWKQPERAQDYLERYEPNRVLLSVGRDLRLPYMKAEEPLNYFVYPYVEVDGRPFESVQTVFDYQNLGQP